MSKLAQLQRRIEDEDWIGALRIAVKFPRLKGKEPIERAWNALHNPTFYCQIGRDPEMALIDGIKALKEFYGKRKSTNHVGRPVREGPVR